MNYEEQLTSAYNALVKNNIATEDEIKIACCLCGFNIETLKSVLYIKIGCRDFEDSDLYEN